MKTLYQLLLDRWNQKTDTVLVTIVEGNGSIPRTTGAYMAVDKTGRIYGTIGGGNLEYQAVKKAMELTGTDAHFVEDFDLETGENGGLPDPRGKWTETICRRILLRWKSLCFWRRSSGAGTGSGAQPSGLLVYGHG